ncbi:MAG TPA: helix-turn-helix domain-containing protein [Ktedonobacteraceae bacterium]
MDTTTPQAPVRPGSSTNGTSPSTRPPLARVPGYLSVKEAAQLIGVSERTIYGYVESGKLPASRIGTLTVIDAQSARRYQRRAPGRMRTRVPAWHVPPEHNQLMLTTITVRLRPGQGERLIERLRELRTKGRHLLPGTAARYIARSRKDTDDLQIVLLWRGALLAGEDQRKQALAALAADLADLLDWEQATVQERPVLLHA